MTQTALDEWRTIQETNKDIDRLCPGSDGQNPNKQNHTEWESNNQNYLFRPNLQNPTEFNGERCAHFHHVVNNTEGMKDRTKLDLMQLDLE